jgi:hypothetical protein
MRGQGPVIRARLSSPRLRLAARRVALELVRKSIVKIVYLVLKFWTNVLFLFDAECLCLSLIGERKNRKYDNCSYRYDVPKSIHGLRPPV